jgi:hypothetical protein
MLHNVRGQLLEDLFGLILWIFSDELFEPSHGIAFEQERVPAEDLRALSARPRREKRCVRACWICCLSVMAMPVLTPASPRSRATRRKWSGRGVLNSQLNADDDYLEDL